MKSTEAQMKIIVPEGLKTAFELACELNDRTMSQVIRDFMKTYVKENGEGQRELWHT